MERKRRLPSAEKPENKKSKRMKFTLEDADFSESISAGVVLVTGSGDFGSLGLGPKVLEKTRPALVNLKHEITDVCAGGMHTVCLTKDGRVLTFGCNDEGALGRKTEGVEDAEFSPGEVALPAKATQISAGDSHTAALLEDGRVFAWGTFRDSHGNMGLTPKGNEKLPYEIIKNVHVVKIASGSDHIVFLTNHGEVYTCGCGEQGQLGRTSERRSGRSARTGVGKAQIVKLLQPSPIITKLSLQLHFDNIWAGLYGTMMKVAGKDAIYVTGLNNYYQLGLSKELPYYYPVVSEELSKYKWKWIESGEHHTIGVDRNGLTYAIGRKEYGRLGLGTVDDHLRSVTLIPTLQHDKVVNVACGSSTSFAVTDKGKLYAWGFGTSGQLGTGSEDDCLVPTEIVSKSLSDRSVLKVSSGGQHTVILATVTNNNRGDSKKK